MVTRRSFLTGAVLGGLVASSPLRGAARLSSSLPVSDPSHIRFYTKDTAPYDFVQGTITEISSDSTLFTLQDLGRPSQVIQISIRSILWKGSEIPSTALRTGDFIYAQTFRDLFSNTAEVYRLWANIGWIHGSVRAVNSQIISVVNHTGIASVLLRDNTLIQRAHVPIAVHANQVVKGTSLSALGVFQEPGVLAATKVWL